MNDVLAGAEGVGYSFPAGLDPLRSTTKSLLHRGGHGQDTILGAILKR